MADHIETLLYQRTISRRGGNVILLASTNPASILIQSQVLTMRPVSVHVPGELGADLIVASSSAYTAATQGMEFHAKIGVATVETFRNVHGEWKVHYKAPGLEGFVIDLDLMPVVLASLQTLLNDITGEYRRRVEQIENNMSPR